MQYWGGPTTYGEERGHPRLRRRHAPHVVDVAARDAWLTHMRAALASMAARRRGPRRARRLPGDGGEPAAQRLRLSRRGAATAATRHAPASGRRRRCRRARSCSARRSARSSISTSATNQKTMENGSTSVRMAAARPCDGVALRSDDARAEDRHPDCAPRQRPLHGEVQEPPDDDGDDADEPMTRERGSCSPRRA